MHRCFIDEDLQIGKEIEVDKFKHLVQSLRMVEGDRIELVGNNGIYICQITSTDRKVLVRPMEIFNESNESQIKISLYQALAKNDKFDHVIRKAVELGVHEIYPVETARTIVRLSAKKKTNRIKRYRTIAESAAEQSKRDYIPHVHDIIAIKDIEPHNMLMAYEISGDSYKEILKDYKEDNISILVGPEGGFEEEEVNLLRSKGAQIINFGPRILRTETAGLFLISSIQYELGDMG